MNAIITTSRPNRRTAVLLVTLLLSHFTSFAQTNVEAVVAAANAYLATLSASQSNSTVYAATLANAGIWSNLPTGNTTRNGLQFSTLNAAQLAAALNVGTNALGAKGANLFEEIRLADGVISAVNSGMWGYGKYYIAFVGVPSTTQPWMLQMGGHHMAYNIVFNAGYTSASPLFTGTEPNSWTNAGVVHAPMGAQRSAIVALRTTLTTAALLSGTFSDVVFGPNGTGSHDTVFPKAYPTTGRGQLYTTLTTSQQDLVRGYIVAWVTNAHPSTSASLLADYFTDAALAQTYIGYAGSSTNMTTQGSYFRVDGPRVWIEFVDQGGVAYPSMVHDHGIYRDKLTDYGAAFGTNTVSTSARPPSITSQPISSTNALGNSVTLSCATTGSATIYFQWLKDGVAISGETNSNYTITSIAQGDVGSYSAKVWNHMGITTSATATLAVSDSGNTAPRLAAIEDHTIAPGIRLSVTNIATDIDTPAQALAFSLGEAPANASIDSGTGILSWRPLISQADTTNSFTVTVTDNGTPAMSATRTFKVTVTPVPSVSSSATSYSNGVFRMSITGGAGPDYIIQSSTNLLNWESLDTNTPSVFPFDWSLTADPNQTVRFFRVLLGP